MAVLTPTCAVGVAARDPHWPDHLARLGRSGWGAWRWALLRSAGFTIDSILDLAAEDAAEAADAPFAAKTAGGADTPEQLAFRRLYYAARARTTERLQRACRDGRFREAVIWQDRGVIHRRMAWFLASAPDSRVQKKLTNAVTAALYLQRYCTKNDTIGFFGPTAWVRLEDQQEALTLRHGPSELAHRSVDFELWSIDALAARLSEDAALRPWMVPRHLPRSGSRSGDTAGLTPTEATVLAACDGATAAADVAAMLSVARPRVFPSPVLVLLILEALRGKGLVVWDFHVPVAPNPAGHLRRRLERIDDPVRRTQALAPLDLLERHRAGIAAVAGDPDALDLALAELETDFAGLTRGVARRTVPQGQSGRTLVFEDCRRDLSTTIGPGLLDAIALPLELLLASARWLTAAAAEHYATLLRDAWQGLGAGKPVPLSALWTRIEPLLIAERQRIGRAIEDEFRGKWAAVLAGQRGVPPHRAAMAFSATALRAEVMRTFACAGFGWRGARYQSADIMLAAADDDAVCRGDYTPVLGEIHVGVNNTGLANLVGQHPATEELHRYTDADLPEPRVLTIFPKWMGVSSRSCAVLRSPRDLALVLSGEPHDFDPSRVLRPEVMIVEDGPGGVTAVDHERLLRLPLTEVFADVMMGTVANSFRIAAPRPGALDHTPRITIDRLVVQRESWAFTAATLDLVDGTDAADRFRVVRGWWRRQRMPRFVFVRSPLEHKPVYVDFDSPLLVDGLVRIVRRARMADAGQPAITISEMLPAPLDLWLPAPRGGRATAEFRFALVDTKSDAVRS